jgi:hypothetical protein
MKAKLLRKLRKKARKRLKVMSISPTLSYIRICKVTTFRQKLSWLFRHFRLQRYIWYTDVPREDVYEQFDYERRKIIKNFIAREREKQLIKRLNKELRSL